MKKIILLLIVLFAFSSCITIYTGFPGAIQTTERQSDFEKTFPAEPKDNIMINSVIGSFNITGFNKKQVIIKGSKSSDIGEFLNDVEINITKKGKILFFSSNIFPKIIKDIDIESYIKTPFETNIQIDMKEGELAIKSIRGDIKIKGENLNINLTDISGKLNITSKAGKIKLMILEWDKVNTFTISTLNGDIEFYAPKEAFLNINAKGKIEEKHKFKKGGATVNLISKNGKIIIDKI